MTDSPVLQISAVVCTHNRAHDYLPRALKSLSQQSLDTSLFEVVVVDNASTDATKQVVEASITCFPGLRYVYEPQVGISSARNRGWIESRGKWIAFLDDDCVAAPDWLESILAVFETVAPTPGCVGGKIELIWEGPRPSWMGDEMLGALGLMDWSEEPIILKDDQFFGEGNSAYPRELLEEVGGFDLSLGRISGHLLSNEGVIVRRKIEVRGRQIYYDPGIKIWHHVAAHKLEKAWCFRSFFWQGASDARVEILLNEPGHVDRAKGLLHVMGRLAWSMRWMPRLMWSGNNRKWFYRQCRVVSQVGEIRAWVNSD